MSTALNKKLVSRENLSLWVLKNPFIKKNMEHSQSERVKNRFQEMNFVEVEASFWTLGISSIVMLLWRICICKKRICIKKNIFQLSYGIKKIHQSKSYPWYTHLGKTFFQLLLFKVFETFLLRWSKKVCSILWSVWARPNRYCLWEENSILNM